MIDQQDFKSEKFENCVVKSILNHREREDGRYEFLVQWQKKNTWEPLQNLISILDLVENYINAELRINEQNWINYNNEYQSNCVDYNQKHNKIDLQDQDTRAFPIKKDNFKYSNTKAKNPFILNFNDFFPSYTSPQSRYKSKMTQPREQSFNLNRLNKIQWNKIKKAVDIQFNQSNKKWMVEIQFEGNSLQNTWIQRDVMRLVNPFALLELYQKIQRKLLQVRVIDQKLSQFQFIEVENFEFRPGQRTGTKKQYQKLIKKQYLQGSKSKKPSFSKCIIQIQDD